MCENRVGAGLKNTSLLGWPSWGIGTVTIQVLDSPLSSSISIGGWRSIPTSSGACQEGIFSLPAGIRVVDLAVPDSSKISLCFDSLVEEIHREGDFGLAGIVIIGLGAGFVRFLPLGGTFGGGIEVGCTFGYFDDDFIEVPVALQAVARRRPCCLS